MGSTYFDGELPKRKLGLMICCPDIRKFVYDTVSHSDGNNTIPPDEGESQNKSKVTYVNDYLHYYY